MKIEIVSIRNIDAVKFRVTGDAGIETAKRLVGKRREERTGMM